jgi:cytoskeleton protein RodZ
MTKGPSMSEFDGQSPASPVQSPEQPLHKGAGAPPAGEPLVSAGTLLRQAREAAGLHIAALAVALKVPVKKLEALEDDRPDLLPDAVFARALAASVCRTLKIDAAQVLALLPQTGKPSLAYPQTRINTPFRSPGDGPGPSMWAQISRPAVLAGLLLLLGALVLIFLPAVQPHGTAEQSVTDRSAGAQAGAGVVVSPAQSLSVSTRPELAGSAAVPVAPAAVLLAAPALLPKLASAAVPALPAASAAPAAALPGAIPAAPSSTGIVVFKARGESWVEVTDAKGVVVLRRTLAAGESAGASGVLPLAAVVGRADATQVQVRGQALDLSALSKDNVARFEVK